MIMLMSSPMRIDGREVSLPAKILDALVLELQPPGQVRRGEVKVVGAVW